MSNIIAAIIFCVLSFVMWLAVFFTVMDKLIGEKKLFLNYVRAIITYLIGSICSVFMTLVSYIFVYMMQRIV